MLSKARWRQTVFDMSDPEIDDDAGRGDCSAGRCEPAHKTPRGEAQVYCGSDPRSAPPVSLFKPAVTASAPVRSASPAEEFARVRRRPARQRAGRGGTPDARSTSTPRTVRQSGTQLVRAHTDSQSPSWRRPPR